MGQALLHLSGSRLSFRIVNGPRPIRMSTDHLMVLLHLGSRLHSCLVNGLHPITMSIDHLMVLQQPEPNRRRYLTCCVRLSPEKEPDRFVALVEALHDHHNLHQLGVQSTSDPLQIRQDVNSALIPDSDVRPIHLCSSSSAPICQFSPLERSRGGMGGHLN